MKLIKVLITRTCTKGSKRYVVGREYDLPEGQVKYMLSERYAVLAPPHKETKEYKSGYSDIKHDDSGALVVGKESDI